MTLFDVPVLTGAPRAVAPWSIRRADGGQLAAYRRLRARGVRRRPAPVRRLRRGRRRRRPAHDRAGRHRCGGGAVLGGVRLAPLTARDIGWWAGSRLVVDERVRGAAGLGAQLVREACHVAEASGVLRFDAVVQDRYAGMFARLGWTDHGPADVAGAPHRRLRWPIDRVQALAERTKAPLVDLLDPFGAAWGAAPAASLGGPGFVGDDGAPVPGTDVVAACDAILPAMVQRDPEWAAGAGCWST